MADQEIELAVSRALDESPDRNFTESVDLAINLRDLDFNDPSNRVDESIVLPAGTGQETKIVVIAEGETGVRAEEVADEVLSGDDLAESMGVARSTFHQHLRAAERKLVAELFDR